MIGRYDDCWAFSSDPDWEIEVAAAVARYKQELADRLVADDVPQMLVEDIQEKCKARPRRKPAGWYSPKKAKEDV